MKLFKCDNCGQLLYFDNSQCERCGHKLGFLPDELALFTLIEYNGVYGICEKPAQTGYRYCENYKYNVCNWLIPEEDDSPYCKACSLNRTIPNIGNAEYRQRWYTI